MPYNPAADIHQYTWYLSTTTGKRYLCTSAGWTLNQATNEWEPRNIHLLEYMTCTPKPIDTEKMITMLQSGSLIVEKSPIE
ncbi:hypothetical protein SAMN05192574_101368 [Mucilaginibacter gossypiicola]|uniref:Uncharacterized protein n=1 Tax=Mucilaginibacter gossypiicola TaxID=551995 RepID=A0A1H8A7M4_9SPHI|nr:hypothetical protein [Mucilaginibacter gossypiicola]SEM65904.1 hypothetical protein SAMN05192574_101368 [Mucilaginibacter gossypiicola]